MHNHKRAHHIFQEIICELCGKKFKNSTNAKNHHKTHHSDFKPEPQQCPFCQGWYSSKRNLRHHIKNIHESQGKEHRCEICNHVSTSPKALKSHIHLIHKSKDRYKCNFCDKTCNRALYMKEHIATHTGEALYACPHCPVTFTHNANWYKHLQNVHKKQFEELNKQEKRPNILKMAKMASEKIRTKKRVTESSNGDLVISSHIVISADNKITATDTETNSSV